MTKQHVPEMTSGSLGKNILIFSFPLMLSNILQVLFNMSDIAVVGRFSGSAALGSVGSCAILVSLFTGLLIGMGSGINTIVARYLGGADRDHASKTVHSSLLVSIIYGVIIAIVGIPLTKTLLVLLKTKPELLSDAVLYLRVYLIGTPALAIFNFGSGVLSAAGDSKRPLRYLFAAGILNILLNLFFVIVLHLGVLGVAIASIVSQYISAVLILRHLFQSHEVYSLHWKMLRIDRAISATVLRLGISAGLQNAIFALANLFIRSAVNSFDTVIVEGNSAASNADGLIYDMMAAFYVACSTFIGQNYGAGKKKRILKSYLISMAYAFLFAAVAGILLLFFGRYFLLLFTDKEPVIAAGMKRLEIMAGSYCVSAGMDCTIAASRGLGKTGVPTVIVILGSCVFRIAWIYTVFAYFHTIPSLYLLYVFSWAITALFEIIYFIYTYKHLLRNLPDQS